MIAIGVIVLVLLVLALIMKGCVDSSRKNALQDYGQAVTQIGTESASRRQERLAADEKLTQGRGPNPQPLR